MPGLATILSQATFSPSNTILTLPPSITTPTLWAYIGGSLAASQNMVPGGTAFSNVGAGPFYPTGQSSIYGAGYGTMYAHTSVAAATALIDGADAGGSTTLIVAFRTAAGSGVIPLLSSVGTDGKGMSMVLQPAASNEITVSVKGTALTLNTNLARGFTAFSMIADVHTDGTGDTTYDLTGNATLGSASGATLRNVSANSGGWSIGDDVSTSTGHATAGLVDIAFAAVVPAALSLGTLQAIYASVKQSLGFRGITI